MAFLIGVMLSLAVSLFARMVGLDKDRAFYPTVLVAVASYYDLFAVIGGSLPAILVESSVTVVFLVAVVLGFKRNLWIVAGALLGHGLFDLVHPHLIANPGVPAWWPMFCMAYDVVAAAWLAWLLRRRARAYSGTAIPEPPSSAGKSLSLGSPSFIGSTVSE